MQQAAVLPGALPPALSMMQPQPSQQMNMNNNNKRKLGEDGGPEKRKGRKKGFVWSHVVTDPETGKVSCLHCGENIKVAFGEKVI